MPSASRSRILPGLIPALCLAAGLLAMVSAGEKAPEPAVPEPAAPEPVVRPIEIDLSQILIQFQGVKRGESDRSREAALKLAKKIVKRARAGESFEELAKKFSEAPTAPRGGRLGIRRSDGFVRPFSEAAVALEVGQISDPVESVFGFHVIKRHELVMIGARQILVMHSESRRANPSINRTKAEAMERVREIQAKLEAGADFAELAREYSDAPRASLGGDMGYFGRGSKLPKIEEVAFALEVGEVSGVIDTPRGLHLVMRYD